MSHERIIVPTVGRIVLFWPANQSGPLAAMVTQVTHDAAERRYLLNLTVYRPDGSTGGNLDVPLYQEGEPLPQELGCATWMEYQIGQAKRTQDLAGELRARIEMLEKRTQNLCDRFENLAQGTLLAERMRAKELRQTRELLERRIHDNKVMAEKVSEELNLLIRTAEAKYLERLLDEGADEKTPGPDAAG